MVSNINVQVGLDTRRYRKKKKERKEIKEFVAR